MTPIARALITTTLLGIIPLQHAVAAAYKWVDADGETHYSQTPPPATPVEVIKTPSGSASTSITSNLPHENSTPTATATPRTEEAAKAEDAAIRAKNCASARNNLELLKTDGEVNVKDANGLLHTLTAAERTARIEKDEKTVKEFCKD